MWLDHDRLLNLDTTPIIYVPGSSQEMLIQTFLSTGRISPWEQICKSKSQVLNAINEWNQENGRVFDLPEDVMNRWPELPES